MKRKPGETLQHLRHRIFMARTANIYRHQRELAEKAGCSLMIDLDWLRKRVAFILTEPGPVCYYCHERLTVRTFSLDHRIPVSRGGSFELSNLDVICLTCNQTKGLLSAYEFQLLVDMIDGWLPEARADVKRRLRAGSKALQRMFAPRGTRQPEAR
jgi:5-methylcytosine-specific restriction endonuclease McrA